MIQSYGETNVGSRKNNEDFLLMYEEGDIKCYVVCDGLGGHVDGEVASKFVSEYLINRFKEKPTLDEEKLKIYVNDANDELIKFVNDNGANTTLTMVVTDGKRAICAHVGDSRIYCMNPKEILYQSKDHSVPQMLVQMGEITEEQIRGHEDSNRLLRVMGMEWDKSKVEINTIALNEDEKTGFIQCSDGFWEYILEPKMIKLFSKSKNPEVWLKKMLKVVKRKANMKTIDNFTAITLMIGK